MTPYLSRYHFEFKMCEKCNGTGSVPDHRYVSLPMLMVSGSGENLVPTKRCSCMGDTPPFMRSLYIHTSKKINGLIEEERYEECHELHLIKKMIGQVL